MMHCMKNIMMKILITGGTGFIGQQLCSSLIAKNHDLCVLTRNVKKAKRRLPFDGIRFIQHCSDIQSDEIFDVVINLAGAPIAKRWSTSYQQKLISSRVALTEQLVHTLKSLKQKPKVLISGSAIGFYGDQADNEVTELSIPKSSFSHDLCASWEASALKAKDLGIRVCTLRTGIVLGKGGGALMQMRFPFLLGLGGPIGNGKQWMSWIHMADLIRLIHFCIENSQIDGPVNATSPHPARNKDFAKCYAKVLHRIALIPMPAIVLRLLLGQMAQELLITGQKVLPTKLTGLGFSFVYPDLELALCAIEQK